MNFAMCQISACPCCIVNASRRKEGDTMAKEKLGNSTEKITKNVLTKFATHYANVACPLFTYQPKVGMMVKKLRKF